MAGPGSPTYDRVVAEGSAVGAGRSTAIVLFTDLVGSTKLRARLGEDAADEVRRTHDRLVARAIEANRGRLVKNLGDGVMAIFSGAADGVEAAVRIQQALDRHNRSGAGAVPLEVRIGVSAGDVAIEEEDCFGTPVIEASRLCGAAQGGQVLVSEVLRWLAGAAGGHEFRSLGALPLKGLPAPVPACEVAWEALPEPSVPMPALLTRAGRIFVGRDEELERLSRLWKETAGGERRVALLAGEPGIGKTRLAIELAGAARESGGIVLAGRCDEDLGVPYQPFVEAMRHYVTHAPERRLGRHAGELARLLPDLPQLVGGLPEPLRSDPETERYRLFDALAAWLSDASAEAPILLVLDDLHWAAKPTLLLLRHVLRSPEPLRLLVVATYRDSDIGRGHPMSDFLADIRRDGSAERLGLSGLDTPAVTAFIEAAAGHRLDEEEEQELPRVVWRETEGNPFFVAEVLRHLAESRAIEQREGRWFLTAAVEELGIPEGVRDVVGRRLSRLSEDANRTLAVAAVVGLEFEPFVVRTAGNIQEDVFLAALEEAVAARLLSEVSGPGARYRFGHALVRATLYDELTRARRTTLHRKVAEAITAIHAGELDDHLPALVHHWSRAAAPVAETGMAVDYAARAGDRALAQLAHDEAAAYYRQALELAAASPGAVDEGQRLELLISLGIAQRRAGEEEYRGTLLDAAQLAKRRGDIDALARAALANSRGAFFGAVGALDAERVGVLEAALDGIGFEETARRARLLANLGVELVSSGDRPRRVALSDEAVALARRLGDLRALADVLLARIYTIQGPDTLGERLETTAELLDMAERLNDPVISFLSAWLRARCVVEIGDPEEADRCLGIMDGLVAELGQPALRWTVGWVRTARMISAGRLAEAQHLSREGLELGRATGQSDAPVFFAAQQFHILFDAGRLGELEEALRAAVARAPGYVAAQLMLAVTYFELGREDEARAIFQPLADHEFTSVPMDYGWMRSMASCAYLSARLGDAAAAQAAYSLLFPYRDQVVVTACIFGGAVVHYLGMLAAALRRFDEAEEHFRASEITHSKIGSPNWLAHTRLEWARTLHARQRSRDDERARELLGQALAAARELGLGGIERRAVELLS
jgi:class 3 adenylate cyclase/tetratricopeptide (TPR) repeat protein